MKRRASRRYFAILLISCCAAPLAYAFSPEQTAGESPPHARGSCAASCNAGMQGNVQGSAIGVYGGTVVDQLSSGAVVLVKWPNGSPHETWTGRSHGYLLPVDPAASGVHVFFLWPDS
jgi:hypothetical protein